MSLKVTKFLLRCFTFVLFHSFWVHADVSSTSGNIHFIPTGSEKVMTLNANRLGIGTESPSANLHVVGNVIVESGQVSLGTTSANSTLHINGSIGFGVTTYTSSATLGSNSLIFADSSAGDMTLTLPYAANVTGRIYKIKKISSSANLFLESDSLIEGDALAYKLSQTSSALPAVQLISNGTEWQVLSSMGNQGLSDNLLLWYTFDESSGAVANDSGPNAYHGNLINFSSTTRTSGKIGNALDFDGADDYVDSYQQLLNGLSQFSFSCWVKSDSLVSGSYDMTQAAIWHDGKTGLGFRNSNLRVMVGKSSGLARSRITDTFSGATWYHFVSVYDGSGATNDDKVKHYIDGNLNSNTNFGSDTVPTTVVASGNLYIGGAADFPTGNGNFFNGLIDDVRVYNKALDAQEVNALYQLGQ